MVAEYPQIVLIAIKSGRRAPFISLKNPQKPLSGYLEILVDPFTDFAKGSTSVRILQSIDIKVARPESFSVMVDAIAADFRG